MVLLTEKLELTYALPNGSSNSYSTPTRIAGMSLRGAPFLAEAAVS
jgi:hypothetical protein